MTLSKQRGEVQQAVQKLKAALQAKLSAAGPDRTGPVNVALLRAIELCNHFAYADHEDMAQFEALKAQVKGALTQPLPDLYQSLPTSMASPKAHASSARPARGSPSRPHHHHLDRSVSASGSFHPYNYKPGQESGQAPQPSTSSSPQRLRASPSRHRSTGRCTWGGRRGGQGRAGALGASVPQAGPAAPPPQQGGRALQPSSSLGQQYAGMSFEEVEAELNAMYAYNGTRRRLTGDRIDWTMPQQLVNSKAFVLNTNNELGDMIRTQDTLARKADAWRARQKVEHAAATRAMYDEQLALLNARRRAELEEKQATGRWMDAQIAENKRRELEDRARQLQAQAATRAMYAGQIKEVQDKRDEEATQAARETVLERMQAHMIEAQERERKLAKARENRARNEATKVALKAAMHEKALAVAAEHEAERKAAEDFKKEMDRRERMRRAEVEARAEKQRQAFERAGGHVLAANLAEQQARDAAEAARKQAEFEAAQQAKDAREKAARQEATRARLATLDTQVAEREAARKAERDELRRLKAEMDAEAAALKAAEARAKEEERRRQAVEFAEKKEALVDERQRRFKTYNGPLELQDRWVHKPVIELEQRAFNNLAVPAKLQPRMLISA